MQKSLGNRVWFGAATPIIVISGYLLAKSQQDWAREEISKTALDALRKLVMGPSDLGESKANIDNADVEPTLRVTDYVHHLNKIDFTILQYISQKIFDELSKGYVHVEKLEHNLQKSNELLSSEDLDLLDQSDLRDKGLIQTAQKTIEKLETILSTFILSENSVKVNRQQFLMTVKQCPGLARHIIEQDKLVMTNQPFERSEIAAIWNIVDRSNFALKLFEKGIYNIGKDNDNDIDIKILSDALFRVINREILFDHDSCVLDQLCGDLPSWEIKQKLIPNLIDAMLDTKNLDYHQDGLKLFSGIERLLLAMMDQPGTKFTVSSNQLEFLTVYCPGIARRIPNNLFFG